MYTLLLLALTSRPTFAGATFCTNALTTIESASHGLHLFPGRVTLDPALREDERVRGLAGHWRNDERTTEEPLEVARVPDPENFGHPGAPNVRDLPIKFPGTTYALPAALAQFRATLQKLIDFEHAANPAVDAGYYAYLTVEQTPVRAGRATEPTGWRAVADGASARERLRDHVYLVSDRHAPSLSRQRFHFRNFDFDRFDVNSELDRQALPEFSYPGADYAVYLGRGLMPTRAAVAREDGARTTLRLTFSRRRFDLAAGSINPLFPYLTAPTAPVTLKQKYLPDANLGVLEVHRTLKGLTGPRLGLITAGGEGARGAALVAELLRREGKQVKFIVTVREESELPEYRVAEDFPESAFESEFDVKALFTDAEWLAQELMDKVLNCPENLVDQIVMVDVGGQSLGPYWGQRDPIRLIRRLRSLHAFEDPQSPNYLVIVGPGYGLPADSPIARLPSARRYRPNAEDRARLLAADRRWSQKLGPSRDAAVNLWLQSLAGDFGPQTFPKLNDHDPAMSVTPEHRDLMVVPAIEAVEELRKIVRAI